MNEWIVVTAHYDKLQLFSHCYDFIIIAQSLLYLIRKKDLHSLWRALLQLLLMDYGYLASNQLSSSISDTWRKLKNA